MLLGVLLRQSEPASQSSCNVVRLSTFDSSLSCSLAILLSRVGTEVNGFKEAFIATRSTQNEYCVGAILVMLEKYADRHTHMRTNPRHKSRD